MPGSKWIGSALMVAIVVLAIPAVRHLRETLPPPPPALRLALVAPPGTELGTGDESLDAAISPDQREIAFVATQAGTTRLWRRGVDSEAAEPLDGTDGAQLPVWSPAGDAVVFFAGGQLRKLVFATRAVDDLADAPAPSGATWLPDGSILFAPQSSGVIRSLRAGVSTEATRLRPGDRAHVFPLTTGVANDFVYTAVGENGRRTVRWVRDGGEHDLAVTSGHGQIVGEQLLVVRDGVLRTEPLDEGAGGGRHTPLATGVGVTAAGRSLFVASPRLLLAASASARARELAWFDFDGRRTGTMGEAGDFWQVRLSPDDRHAAVTLVAPLLRTLDIALVPAAGAPARPLTLALAADTDPVWAPDGRRVVFRSLQSGRPMLYTRRAHDPTAEDETLLDGDATPTDWRGSQVLVHMPEPARGQDVVAIETVRQTQTPLVKSGFNDTDARWSPDLRWLAYVSDESGRPDIYADPPEGGRLRVSFASGTRPRWSRDGRSLFFLRGSTIMRATLPAVPSENFATPVPLVDVPGVRDFDVAHRRDALLVLAPVSMSAAPPVSAIVNWSSLVPAAR